MAEGTKQWFEIGLNGGTTGLPPWAIQAIDVTLVLALVYAVLVLASDRRTLWLARGFIILMLAAALSRRFGLVLLSFLLNNLTIGAAVAMAVILQSEFRRVLEQLGRGRWAEIWGRSVDAPSRSDNALDELVDAVKQLSQSRTGALIVVETNGTVDDRDFSVAGVNLDAEISKELLQTIFQTTTLLHDGAVFVRGARIVSAGAILPLSDRQASRQLGTRHRAAMGLTERVPHCLCVVVSEETGSISLAERGNLDRPLTASRLRELLDQKLDSNSDRDARSPVFLGLGRSLRRRARRFLRRTQRTANYYRRKNKP